ncbi:hypothetical protein [Demequina litorisediminis]|uniref:hypothetical protein n=1 Tax=Demequina litorisediminis TaxID=1849022 RepID=UPI0024E108BA|nr:hypothetical protein [Demequina litorisediminis]
MPIADELVANNAEYAEAYVADRPLPPRRKARRSRLHGLPPRHVRDARPRRG